MSTATTEPATGAKDERPPVLDSGPDPKAKWQVGTLVYTTAGLVVLFFWLLFGDFAVSMRDRSVWPVVPLLLKKFNTSDTAMGILMTVLPPAISVVLGPIVSFKSDRYRSRWGRRIPFLLIPTPIAAVSMIALAYSPALGHDLHAALGDRSPGLHVCFLAVFGLFWTLFEFAVVTATAVLGGLINDVVPRPVLGRFYGLFRAVSLMAGMLFNGLLLGSAEEHFKAIFLVIGLVYGIGFSIMCLKVKEGHYPPPEPVTDDPRAGGFIAATRVYFRECFSRPYYLWVFGAMLMALLTFLPFNTFSIPYAKSINMDMGFWGKGGLFGLGYGGVVTISYGTSLVLAYPLGALVDRFHSLRVGLAALLLYALSVLYGAMAVHDAMTFGIALLAHTVLSGTYFTATASLGQALFPRMKFGQYASAAGIVGSLGTIALGFVIGPMLDASGHEYRLTFVAGLILCCTTIVLLYVVYRHFMKLGGPKHYVAPGDDIDPTAGRATTTTAAGH